MTGRRFDFSKGNGRGSHSQISVHHLPVIG